LLDTLHRVARSKLDEARMDTPTDQVMELIFGRWRSQVLYAGAELDVFDHLDRERAKSAQALARELDVNAELLYRLLRAQAAIGLLEENEAQGFVLTDRGALLRSDHPQSLKAMARLAEGPQHYALWKHLPALVRDGKQNAFVREFGCMAFDYARTDQDYGHRFKQGMSSYSAVQSALTIEAMRGCDLTAIRTFCDVGGGHGHLMCAILKAYQHITGIVFDQPDVVDDYHELWAPKLGLGNRCRYVGGDMFKEIPAADAYSLKMILHDWTDKECIDILLNLRRAAPGGHSLFVAEHVVPGPGVPHLSKLFDIHMMCWGTGQERTKDQYVSLLEASGYRLRGIYFAPNRSIGVIHATPI
jgi:hypothetical protein